MKAFDAYMPLHIKTRFTQEQEKHIEAITENTTLLRVAAELNLRGFNFTEITDLLMSIISGNDTRIDRISASRIWRVASILIGEDFMFNLSHSNINTKPHIDAFED